MKTISNEMVVCYDVDNTLVEHVSHKTDIEVDYYGEKKYLVPIREHVELLRAHSLRKFFVVVWSNNGYQWAETVVKRLGLVEHVDLIITKPCKVVDDAPVESWVNRIYIKGEIKQ